MRISFAYEESDFAAITALFLVDLLVPEDPRVREAERFLWRLWQKDCSGQDSLIIALTIELSEIWNAVSFSLSDVASSALQSLMEEARRGPWKRLIDEYEDYPDCARARLTQFAQLENNGAEMQVTPFWGSIWRLVEATTARIGWRGDEIEFRNFRGPLPSPIAGTKLNGDSRTPPYYQLLTFHSLTVPSLKPVSAYLGYNIRANPTQVANVLENSEGMMAVNRHRRNRGTVSGRHNRLPLPALVEHFGFSCSNYTFSEGLHGYLYLMKTEATIEPILSLPRSEGV
jgi:hypothetical protein